MSDQLDRRDFCKQAAKTAAVAAVTAPIVTSAAAPKNKKIRYTDALPVKKLGKTGVKLPILGFGGAALPKAWGNPLSVEDRVKLIRYAYDRGIRLFDTAGNYPESNELMGHGLKGIRNNVFLASKVETTNPAEVRKQVESNLKRLQTDYLDLVQLHGTPGIEQMSVKRAMQVHAELIKLKDEKMIRFTGLTGHGYFDKLLELISTGAFDQCMLAYGYIPRGDIQMFSERMLHLREQCFAEAQKRKMGIAAMKIVGAGILGAWSKHLNPVFDLNRHKDLPSAAIRYIRQDKRMDSLVIGMRLPAEIDANIKIITENKKFTKADEQLLKEYTAIARNRKPLKDFRID